MVISLTGDGVAQDQVCDAETQVKLSRLASLRHNHRLKAAKSALLKDEVKEAKEILEELIEDMEDLQTTIFNETTPEIEELETMETCDGSLPLDCCQVCKYIPIVLSYVVAS